jgi:mono/diheme cytochrome c family protein
MAKAGRVLIVAGAIAALTLPAVAADRSPQQVWNATCSRCHDTGAAPQILGMHVAVDTIKTYVRQGGMQMLPFTEDQVSDSELDALAKWVNEHAPPKAQ